jgi:hypothetical protein
MGGPSARQFVLSPGIHVTPKVDYDAFEVDGPEGRRRAIYRFLFRTLPDPMMDALDCADGSQLTPVRGESITAAQALTLLNHPFLVRQSEHFAARIEAMSRGVAGRIEAAYWLALGRAPSPEETLELISFVKKHGLVNFCRVLFNSSEFMFVN